MNNTMIASSYERNVLTDSLNRIKRLESYLDTCPKYMKKVNQAQIIHLKEEFDRVSKKFEGLKPIEVL